MIKVISETRCLHLIIQYFIMLAKNVHDKGYSGNKSFVLNYKAFYYVDLERS
jgi:hypothetical protein